MEKDIKIFVKDRHGQEKVLELPTNMGLNIMEACQSYDLPVAGVCGGMAMCASCHCYILSDHVPLLKGKEEQAMLDEAIHVRENSRLGCQILLTEDLDGLEIELAPEDQNDQDDEW